MLPFIDFFSSFIHLQKIRMCEEQNAGKSTPK